jgi:hypothetical protein
MEPLTSARADELERLAFRGRAHVGSQIVTDATKSFSEFSFRGTPAEAAAMHEALRPHVERGDVEIVLAIGQDLDPLEVAETIRVLETGERHDDTCKFVRELLARGGAPT